MIVKLQNTTENIEKIFELEKLCFFEDAWNFAMISSEFSNTFSHIFAYDINNETVGYMFFQTVLDEVQISNLAVHPSFRNRGIGQKLLSFAIEFCKNNGFSAIFLEANVENHSALNLYKKVGFEIVGIRKNYYRENRYSSRDAYTLKLDCKAN